MRIEPARLRGAWIAEPEVHEDSRGFFLETFSRRAWSEAGVDADFVQDNQSRSSYGVLRGLHFQAKPGQAKLVRVARGRILDVIVDVRRSSPTFGEHELFELDDRAHRQLYVPIGFAHGFCALSDVADVAYKVSSYYDGEMERGIAWDDPDLGIRWPIDHPIVSERDRSLPRLASMLDALPAW
jgi:dTDP-4-dehydrorhamnose 3,5-epimerase